jgi:hypothetical protein
VSINVWRLAGDTLNITCNFLYCNHQVHRDFLITLYKEVIWLASVHCSTTPQLHCSRQLTATVCTPVPATVPITLPFMKAHQTMKMSQFTAFKNMWVHKYPYRRLLLNIKKLGKISKPLYIILHFTRIRRNSSLIYKESPELFDAGNFTQCKQSVLPIHAMLPCANTMLSCAIIYVLYGNGRTILEFYCLASNFLEVFKFFLYTYSLFSITSGIFILYQVVLHHFPIFYPQ